MCVCVVFAGVWKQNLWALQRLPGRVTAQYTLSEDSLLRRLQLAKDTARVEILDSLAWMYRGTDFARAMRYAQQAAREVSALGYPRVRAENNNYLGIVYRNVGNYAKAMEYFVEARTIAEKYGYKREEGYALNNIGEVYKYQRNFTESKAYALRSLRIFEELRDSAGLYYCYIRLGEIAQNLHDDSSALHSFQKTLVYSKAFRNAVWEAGAVNRIGQVYLHQKAYSQALQTFFTALNISTHLPHSEDEQSFILIQIGKSYRGAGKTDSALVYLHQGIELAEKIGLKQRIREAAQALTEIYTSRQNYAQALRFQTVQMAMNDSLFDEAGRRETEKLSVKYEIEKQQRALDSLSAAQKEERLIGVILAVSVALLLVIALLLYRNIRVEHRANAEILRQQRILEDQSAEIEVTNTTLQEQNEELAALNLEKTELMGIVAHDLKNPIGAVRGLAELIESGMIEGEHLHEAAHQIVVTGDRMLALVTNVLDSNRLDSGGVGLHLVELDILPVIEATCAQYLHLAEAKQITVHYLPETPAAVAKVDEQAIMQVLDNLISNAVKYSPLGKNVFVRGKANTEVIRVEVQDEGEGISSDDMKRLFGKFARLSARPTGGEHSTGLGLSIVKKLVEAMNGSVWCESEVGNGATFIVELPKA